MLSKAVVIDSSDDDFVAVDRPEEQESDDDFVAGGRQKEEEESASEDDGDGDWVAGQRGKRKRPPVRSCCEPLCIAQQLPAAAQSSQLQWIQRVRKIERGLFLVFSCEL